MESDDPIIRDLEIMAGALKYNEWIFSQYRSHLGRRIMEVGAGIGNFTSRLVDREIIVAADNYGPCVQYLNKKFGRHKNIVPITMDISSDEMRGLKRYQLDTVICFNVLEHVQDDMTALVNMFDILQKNGKLLLLVPAFMPLFGTIDHLVGHYRRYNKTELQEKVIDAGFIVREAFYMNSLAFFGWFMNNRILKKREESQTQVKFYDWMIVPWLRRAENICHPPFGLSVVVIAEKR